MSETNIYEAEVRSALAQAEIDGKNVMYTEFPVWHVSEETIGKLAQAKDLESRYIKKEGVFVMDMKGAVVVLVFTAITQAYYDNVSSLGEGIDPAFSNINDVLLATTYRASDDAALKVDVLVARPHPEPNTYMMQSVSTGNIENTTVESREHMAQIISKLLLMVIDTQVPPDYTLSQTYTG